MTVRELIETLETCNPDAEVRIGTQSKYPFQNRYPLSRTAQNRLIGAVDGNLIAEFALDEDNPLTPADLIGDFAGPVDLDTVYLLEGSQLGYLTTRAWDAIR